MSKKAMSLQSLNLRRKKKNQQRKQIWTSRWESDNVTRDSYPRGSRSEVKRPRGIIWFRVQNSSNPFGRGKGHDQSAVHLLVIESKWETLPEFLPQEHAVGMAIVKINTVNHGWPKQTNKHRYITSMWKPMLSQTQSREEREWNNSLQKPCYFL